MSFSLRNLLFITVMAMAGIYAVKATAGFVPFAPYKTFVQAV